MFTSLCYLSNDWGPSASESKQGIVLDSVSGRSILWTLNGNPSTSHQANEYSENYLLD